MSDYEDYVARYCEWCGDLVSASEELAEMLDEPVHRADILEALGGLDDPEVTETVAEEIEECECGGQIVRRHYAVGDVPEPPEGALDNLTEDDYVGRDPDEDALLFDQSGNAREVSEVPGLTEDAEQRNGGDSA